MKKPWTEEQDAAVRQHYGTLTAGEIAKRLGRTTLAVVSRAGVLGLRNQNPWTQEEEDLLRERYSSAPMHELCAELNRTDIAIRGRASILGLKRRGSSPDVKERSRRHSEFMKARRQSGVRNPGVLPIGTTRMQGGKLYTKVADTADTRSNWVRAQRVVWEAAHGPIPDGHMVTFKDGNRLNLALENLELVSGTTHMARNTIARYPLPYQNAVKALGRFMAKLKRLEKDREKSK